MERETEYYPDYQTSVYTVKYMAKLMEDNRQSLATTLPEPVKTSSFSRRSKTVLRVILR